MYFYLYQITNNINGKIYVGVHKTRNLEDGYMGSGKILNIDYKKYGLENFTKIILEYFQNSDQMYLREKEIVNKEFLARLDVYNLRVGGYGGFDVPNKLQLGTKKQKFLREHNKKWKEKCDALSKKNLVKARQIFKEKYPNGVWQGKNHTEDSRAKMREAKKRHGVGKSNSQYGSMWITNGIENKKIKKDDILPQGWYPGRKV